MQSKHRDPHLKGLHRETNDYTSPKEKSKSTSNTDKQAAKPRTIPSSFACAICIVVPRDKGLSS